MALITAMHALCSDNQTRAPTAMPLPATERLESTDRLPCARLPSSSVMPCLHTTVSTRSTQAATLAETLLWSGTVSDVFISGPRKCEMSGSMLISGPNTAVDAANAASSCLAQVPSGGVFTPTRGSSAPSQTGSNASRSSGNAGASSAPANSSGAAGMAREIFGSSWIGGVLALAGVGLGAVIVL